MALKIWMVLDLTGIGRDKLFLSAIAAFWGKRPNIGILGLGDLVGAGRASTRPYLIDCKQMSTP